MDIKERINKVFKKYNTGLKATVETNLEAQAVLDNGTVIFTDSDSFAEGAEVYIVNDEGEHIPLPEGDYTLEDGSTLTIVEGGLVGAVAVVEEVEAAAEDGALSVDDVKAIVLEILNERFPVEDEMSAEDKESAKVEAKRKDVEDKANKAVQELTAQLKAQSKELTTLKAQSASKGVKRVVSTQKEVVQVDLSKLSTEDRVKALFNKYNS